MGGFNGGSRGACVPPVKISGGRSGGGFTLFEVVMAMMILGLLAGAVYSLATAALETSKAVKAEHQAAARLDSFLRILRETFVNLPPEAAVSFNMEESGSGVPVPEVVFERAPGAFGFPSMGTASLVLSARPLSDGTREFALMLRQERNTPVPTRGDDSDGMWVPLFGGVENVMWKFKRGSDEWVEEWPSGAGRPRMVRLSFDYAGMPGRPVDMQFWVPAVEPPPKTAPAKNNGGAAPGENVVEPQPGKDATPVPNQSPTTDESE